MAKDKKNTQNDEKVIRKNDYEVENNKMEKKRKEHSSFSDKKVMDAMDAINNNGKSIILFVVGFLLATLLFRCILWPDRIATLKDGTQPVVKLKDDIITANDLYDNMKEYYSINVLVNNIDEKLLTEKYPSNDEMENSIKNTADYYYSNYENNGYTKQDFLNQYGFSSEAQFLDSLRLDYRRNKYYDDYILGLIDDKDVQKYYDNDVFGDVDSKHILVSTGEDGLSDDEAKKLANEIIGKLNKGTSWDDVTKEYKDKIVTEELGYNAFNAKLESAYLKECKDLAVESYSKTPVKTSYGYHIVYKIAQKEKPKLEEVKDDIKDILAEKKKNSDTNLYYKALIQMRKDAEIEFVDTKFGEQYTNYVNNYK